MTLPIVIMSFQDHSADLEGHAEPYKFVAMGAIIKETPEGYLLGHWLNVSHPDEKLGEVTTYVAKVKGLKKQQIGVWRMK